MRTLMLVLVVMAGCGKLEPCDPGQKLVGAITCVPDVPPGAGGMSSGGMSSGGASGGGSPSGGSSSGEAGADANEAGNSAAD
jgi:hypothetical protein